MAKPSRLAAQQEAALQEMKALLVGMMAGLDRLERKVDGLILGTAKVADKPKVAKPEV